MIKTSISNKDFVYCQIKYNIQIWNETNHTCCVQSEFQIVTKSKLLFPNCYYFFYLVTYLHSQLSFFSFFLYIRYPSVTGTSVLGLRFKDGVVIAADKLGSYGSMARFRDLSRILKVSMKKSSWQQSFCCIVSSCEDFLTCHL